jgi:hypothetical protein
MKVLSSSVYQLNTHNFRYTGIGSLSLQVVKRLRLTDVIAARHVGAMTEAKRPTCSESTRKKVLLDHRHAQAS